MAKLLTEFEHYPEEGRIIGRLLAAYGELEFALMSCVSVVMGRDTNTACRILFRVKGESARIEVSDAILRPAFSQLKLEGQWGAAIGALHHCRRIRNQFAHCHWWADENGLFFMNFDDDVKSTSSTLQTELSNIDTCLLQRQEAYFEYTLNWMFYLTAEVQKRQRIQTSQPFLAPQSNKPPPLHNPQDTHPPSYKRKGDGRI